jgi:isocitrate dehydrogenase (NAD+)
MYPVTLIPGDGTGPEISEATKRVIEATGVPIKWDIQEAGLDVFEREGTPLPQRVIDSIKRNKIAIKGPITTPVGTGFRSVNVPDRCSTSIVTSGRQGHSRVRTGLMIDPVIIRDTETYIASNLRKA